LPQLLLATSNRGKVDEFSRLLADLPLTLTSLLERSGAPVVDEDGASYLANATRKALAIARWSGCVTLADDSGLEVDALQGAPGIRSARYAGPDQNSSANIAKLLQALSGVPQARRAARFRCALVVASPGGAALNVAGTCEGRIGEAPQGSGGFGYDPLFLDIERGITFAEMPVELKDRISHRARACAALRLELTTFLAAHAC
jgi:XTP/dITP diphosphohydrolase